MKGIKRSKPGEADNSKKRLPRREEEDESSLPEEEGDSDGSNAQSGEEQSQSQSQSQTQSARRKGEDGGDSDAGKEGTFGVQDDDGKGDVAAAGGGEGGGGGGLQPKRQKVEQLDEVPLVIPTTVSKDTKASLLVHLRDETLDFSGDTGAVGRIAVGGKKKGRALTFDLKGQQFSGQIVPSATVLVVGVGRTEAKVEGLFSEVCRLDFKGNVLDSMGGEVLKGEMDDSYKFEEEDVNVRGGGGEGGGAGVDDGAQKGGGGRTPKLGRKKSFGKKKGSSSAKKGAKTPTSKTKKS